MIRHDLDDLKWNYASVLPFLRPLGQRPAENGDFDPEKAAALPQQGIYPYVRAYLATCSWVKHDVNPRQNQRRLIRHLRREMRDVVIRGRLSYA